MNKENILEKFVKSLFNPTPLNTRFRKDFNLGENYKLVYLLENERMHLFLNYFMNLLFPPLLLSCFTILMAELTGLSKFNEVYDQTYFYLAGVTCWLVFVYALAKKTQKSTIMRIYFDQQANKFVSIRMGSFFRFKKEEFTPDNVVYRFGPSLENKIKYFENMTKRHGNVYINNTLQQVNFKHFTSNNVVEKMVGSKSFNYLKSKSELE